MEFTENNGRESIYRLQQWLLMLSRAEGLPRVVPDGIYGGETRNAVAEFQRTHGLNVTGVVDLATWNALRDAAKTAEEASRRPREIRPFDRYLEGGTVKKGDNAPIVALIRIMLEELDGYDLVLETSGIFDDETESAVMVFQQSVGLDPSGIVDIVTWNELARSYDAAISPGGY